MNSKTPKIDNELKFNVFRQKSSTMSDEDDKLKIHIHYGGVFSNEGNYVDGEIAPDMVVDPDLLTFSIFEDFRKGERDVEKLRYKLPNEDISEARLIWKDKDREIMKMAAEAQKYGEVHIYIEHRVSPIDVIDAGSLVSEVGRTEIFEQDDGENADVEDGSDEEVSEEESDGEQREEVEESDEEVIEEEHNEDGVQSEEEDQILGEGDADPRFENLFETVESETHNVPEEDTQPNADADESVDSDVETEKQLPNGEYPDSPEDTDDEWHNWQKKDDRGRRLKGKSKADYDKPPYLWLMQTFNNADEFKDQLLRYVLKTQYDVKLNKWQATKHAAICSHEKCGWRIYCSLEKPIRKWMVKVYEDKHNHLPTGRARMLSQGTIAKLFKEEARRRPDIRSSDIKDELMHRYNLSVSIYKCRKARRIALDMVLETQKQQFAKLWDYEAELKRSNKNVTTEIVTVEKDGRQVFESFYICFEPLRRTWKKCCRPVIGLDGAFLKWELKGEILSAVGRDAENRIYPIAWAVVRGENRESWEWFMKKLTIDLGLGVGDRVTFISDKQKGLKVALATVLPKAEHRNCAKHVYANWKKKDGDIDYKPFFWNVAYSKTVGEYDLHIAELKAFDINAHDDLLAVDPTTWCLAFFTENARSAHVCNSLSESFNKTIKGARELPLINMLEAIRRQAMTHISRRFMKARACILPFPKKVGDVLEVNRKESKDCTILISSDNVFEVDLYGCGYEVCLRLHHCACRGWDLTGIPCSHAIAVINDSHKQPENHVDDYYKTEVWKENYASNIKPVNGEIFWAKTGKEPIGVPGFRKMPGRPKKKRIKPAHESPSKPNRVTRGGRTMTCSNCKQSGHNCGTCKNPPFVVQGPPRKRGRPRKNPVDDNPNQSKKRRTSLSQPSNSSTAPQPRASSTAPQPQVQSQPTLQQAQSQPTSSNVASGHGRGRGRRGRPPGRGQARKVTVPRGQGVYMCPFTDRVFECFGSTARECGGSSSKGTKSRK